MTNVAVCVIGAGMFGTVLANIVARNGFEVRLLSRDAGKAADINARHENVSALPGHRLDDKVRATADGREALSDASVVLLSVPSRGFRAAARDAATWLQPDAMVVSTTKGIEAPGFKLMSAVLTDELPGRAVGVLSGPNLAAEIADDQITGTVIASTNPALNAQLQAVLHSHQFRVYSSADVFGVELAGALKNMYAIAAGMASSMGVGQNTRGVLLTRSLAEMSRFGASMGANPLTFLGLAGVGDLFVTCSSPLSRNYQIGALLGQGLGTAAAEQQLGRLAEGINTVRTVKAQADTTGVYMPIVAGLHAVLFEHKPLQRVIVDMMTTEEGVDVEFVTGQMP